jgi:hypothetical protein
MHTQAALLHRPLSQNGEGDIAAMHSHAAGTELHLHLLHTAALQARSKPSHQEALE